MKLISPEVLAIAGHYDVTMLGAFLLAEADIMNVSWQGFILLNLVGIIGLAFWLGGLNSTLQRQKEDLIRLDNRTIEDRVRLEKSASEDRLRYEAKLQRMRSAYHHVSAYLAAKDDRWQPHDVDQSD